MKVQNHSGTTTRDILNHIRQVMRKKPDCIIIHAGTNDLTSTNEINGIENLKNIVKEAKENSPLTEIELSTVVMRKDKQALGNKIGIDNLNKKIKSFARESHAKIIDNSNVNESCLSDSFLANNFLSCIKNF